MLLATHDTAGLKIAAVIGDTGVSRELIHHYLRQGLVPASEKRGVYSPTQVRLLRLTKSLRDEHHLPLELIRALFEAYDFAPAPIEALTCSESLLARLGRFAGEGALVPGELVTAEVLAERAQISMERLEQYLEADLLSPLETPDGDRFGVYDQRIVSLCEHGVEQGIPFETFCTIASYVRIGFELEQAKFFTVSNGRGRTPENVLATLFLRREVAGAFVQNVLQSLLLVRFHSLLEQRQPEPARFDKMIYRPSAAFLARHGLVALTEETRKALAEAPERRALWVRAAALLLYAGRDREAVFLLEDALRRFPDDAELVALHGRALVLAGELDDGIARLETAASLTPADRAFLSIARVRRAKSDERLESLVREGHRILESVEEALDHCAGTPTAARLECTVLSGWALSALPNLFEGRAHGLELLRSARRELADAPVDSDQMPGFYDALRLQSAALLFWAGAEADDHEALRHEVCRLDPASDLAEHLFLSDIPLMQR